MTIETSVAALTTQTSSLLGVCTALQANTTTLIANAVTASQNAAQIPLVTMATNLVNTQTLLVTFISRTKT